MLSLYLRRSRGRREFKDLLGQANHLIVTCLVGLDAIERGIVTSIPPELHAAWSPKNPKVSSLRARRLLLDMALVRSIDALDVYIREGMRKPFLIQSPALRSEIDRAKLSIFKKFRALANSLPTLDPLPVALIDLMIAWRNRSAHSEGDNKASDASLQTISRQRKQLAERFRGLDSEALLAGYAEARSPTFKEIASFINATHHFVADVEDALLKVLDVEVYAQDLVWVAASAGNKALAPDIARRKQFQSVWGRDFGERRRYVLSFLKHHGLTDEFGSGATFTEALLDRLCAMTPREVHEWAKSGRDDDHKVLVE